MINGVETSVPLFDGELNDEIMEYLLAMAEGTVTFDNTESA